jgi:hypothetical protein
MTTGCVDGWESSGCLVRRDSLGGLWGKFQERIERLSCGGGAEIQGLQPGLLDAQSIIFFNDSSDAGVEGVRNCRWRSGGILMPVYNWDKLR